MNKRTFMTLGTLVLAAGLAWAAAIQFKHFMTVEAGVNPRGVAVGDVTGDGLPDLAVVNFGAPTFIGHDTPQTVLNPQNCTLQLFSPSSSGLILKDTVHTNFSPRGVAVANLKCKGGAEVLVTTYDAGKLQIYTWDNGKLHQVEENPNFEKPVGVAAASLKTGWPVVVAVANFASNKVSLLEADHNGKLKNRFDVPVNQGPVQVAIGDVDGDGVKEIVAACIQAHKLDILSLPDDMKELDLSKASVVSSLDLPQGSEPADLDIADLNVDGRADIAACNFLANTLAIFYQNATGGMDAKPVVATGGLRPNGMTVGDLDKDGVLECIVANRDSDVVDVFKTDAGGNYAIDSTLKVAGDKDMNLGPIEPAVIDANRDGVPDLVVSHMRSNSLRVLLQGVSTAAPTPQPAGVPFSDETTVAYPNPSKGKTTIRFTLSDPCEVTVRIFDLTGQQVWSAVIPASQTRRGPNELPWGGVNLSQAPVASGMYVLQVTAEGKTVTRKVAIIR